MTFLGDFLPFLSLSQPLFTVWVTKHWDRPPKEAVESCLGELKTCLDTILSD